MSEHLIRLTQVYYLFGMGTKEDWYRVDQLRNIGTSRIMCSRFESDWFGCMSSWFDLGGLSLVCRLRLTKLVDVRNRFIGTS